MWPLVHHVIRGLMSMGIWMKARAMTGKQIWLTGFCYVKNELGNVSFLEIWEKEGKLIQRRK